MKPSVSEYASTLLLTAAGDVASPAAPLPAAALPLTAVLAAASAEALSATQRNAASRMLMMLVAFGLRAS
jgi:hypothetical protein